MILFRGFKFGSVIYASWGKNCAGATVPLVEHDWLKRSHDKYDTQRQRVMV